MSSEAGTAIPWITLSPAGEFEVQPEAQALLHGITGRLAVISVVGLYRTGKSFLLNLLLGHDGSEAPRFQVGSTVNACTKGLWLWSQPLVLEDGTHVLFVDTEGLGSTDRAHDVDVRLFSLSLLLSSTLVYNSRGIIDGQALDELSLVCELAKHVQAGAQQQQQGAEAALAEFFPSLLWSVRDFTLALQNERGDPISSRQYLENALKPQQGFSEEVARRNQVRAMLASFFSARDCVTLARPVDDEAQLRDLSAVPYAELRPKFREGFERLRSKLLDHPPLKQMYGQTVNGAMLGALADSYATAFNSGAAPVISSAWQRVCEAQCAEAVEAAQVAYRAAMGAQPPAEDAPEAADALLARHAAAKAEAKAVFNAAVVDDSEAVRGFRHELRDALRTALRDAEARNRERSDAHCRALLERLHADIAPSSSGDEGERLELLTYKQNLDGLVAQFAADPTTGPAADAALAAFMRTTVLDAIVACAQDAERRHAAAAAELQSELNAKARELADLTGRHEAAEQLQAQEQTNFQHALKEQQLEAQREKELLEQQVSHMRSEVSEAKEQVQFLQQLAAKPTTGGGAGAEGTDMVGYLMKRPIARSSGLGLTGWAWKQRYFVLAGAQLSYYNSKDDYERRRGERPPLVLTGAQIEPNAEDQDGIQAVLADGSVMKVRALSTAEQQAWLEALRAAAN